VSVLLVRAGALGDVLLLRRAVFALRRAGHAVQIVAPAAPGAALVGTSESEAERLWPWDGPDVASLLAGDLGASGLVEALRSAAAVVAYTRSPSLIDSLHAQARRLVAHDPSPPAEGPHASRWLAEPLRELGVLADADPPALVFSEGEHASAASILARLPRPFIAIHPGSGSLAKNWPAERFVALADRLGRDRPVLLVLGPAENAAFDPIASHRAHWVVARELPLRSLGALLSHAALFVGNDSGASHLAAAAGAPTLALFGPTDPALWAPLGPRVRSIRAPGGRMDALDVESVWEATASLAGAPSPSLDS
jgi:heptosyltransferase-2